MANSYFIFVLALLLPLVTTKGTDGGWSNWSKWSACISPNCSNELELKNKFRYRFCNSPKPEDGAMCVGRHLSFAVCFKSVNCLVKVDGEWSPWSKWNCFRNTAQRHRLCNNPAPLNGGENCSNNPKDAVEFITTKENFAQFVQVCKNKGHANNNIPSGFIPLHHF